MTSAASSFGAPVTLADELVRLEPLAGAHREGLLRCAADPAMWRYWPVTAEEAPPERLLALWWQGAAAAQAAGREVVFAVRRTADGDSAPVIGTTRFLNIAPEHRRLEVGGTYYLPEARRTYVNAACKRLLFAHAFDALGAVRVELKCDARNAASRAAIAAVGGTEEGTLRRHLILATGYVRDSVYFSVIDSEWPDVRAALDRRLAARAGARGEAR